MDDTAGIPTEEKERSGTGKIKSHSSARRGLGLLMTEMPYKSFASAALTTSRTSSEITKPNSLRPFLFYLSNQALIDRPQTSEGGGRGKVSKKWLFFE